MRYIADARDISTFATNIGGVSGLVADVRCHMRHIPMLDTNIGCMPRVIADVGVNVRHVPVLGANIRGVPRLVADVGVNMRHIFAFMTNVGRIPGLVASIWDRPRTMSIRMRRSIRRHMGSGDLRPLLVPMLVAIASDRSHAEKQQAGCHPRKSAETSSIEEFHNSGPCLGAKA